jgi:ComF family protein
VGPSRAGAELPRRLGALAASLGEGLLDTLFPPRCVDCGELLPPAARLFCEACRASLEELPLPHSATAGAGAPVPIVTWAVYGGAVERGIVRLKFAGEPWLAEALVREAFPRLRPALVAFRPERVLPVPLHPSRLRRRGYNQAARLARPLAAALQVPLDQTSLQRIRPTPPQTTLDGEQRRTNLRDAFQAAAAQVAGRRLLLVDDVITTGSTVAECARALDAAGARAVAVCALARTLPARSGP